MSKLQPLRAFVNERLNAAVDEIFVLFERTIAEYEEQLCRSKEESQRKQQLLDAVLKPRILLPKAGAGVQILPLCPPDPGLNQEITETAQIKEEPEEQNLQQEEEQQPGFIQEHSAVCVKTEESPVPQLRHTELREETQEEDIPSEAEYNTENSSDTDNDDLWNGPIHPADGKMETEADADVDSQVQKRNRSTAAQDPDWDAAEDEERGENKKVKRHKEVTPDELDDLMDEREERNTMKTTKWAVKILRDFLTQKNMDINFESYDSVTLNDTLRLFYASVQSTKEGGEYSLSSLNALRAGINRSLPNVNIISDSEFKSSNLVFKAISKRCGKNISLQYPRIPESDLEILRRSQALSPDTPLGLVRKVWFDVQLCLARRGREGNREMNMTSFSIHKDQEGIEYIRLSQNDAKNSKGLEHPHKHSSRGLMFARPGDPLCPVKSFKKYISKCPPDAKSFYLHPRRNVFVGSDVWYSREAMGLHYLGDMLKKICEEVGLPQVYTNHSLRSTAVSLMSGHCCEKSQKGHWPPPVQNKQEWINILPPSNVPASSSQAPQTFYVLQMPM